MKMCPVCGKPADELLFSEYGDEIYCFACPPCKVRFDENPDRYVTAGPQRHDHSRHGGYNHSH
jgi:YHS domain-containing protein